MSCSLKTSDSIRGEEENDDSFSKALAALGDVYINDAFGAAHRAHASTVGITKFIPASAAGFLLKKEIEYLEEPSKTPFGRLSPFSAGQKCRERSASSKIWASASDKVIIGGGMAFTFLKAKGLEIGNSLVENDMLDFAKGIEDHALSRGREILSAGRLCRRDQPRAWGGIENRPGPGNSERVVRPRHWPGLRKTLQRSSPEREDDSVEWTDGCL